MSKFGLVAALCTALAISALGTPQKKKPAAPLTCPVCHMALSKTKTKADPVAIRLKKTGPVYYCCAGCKMPAGVLVKTKK